MSKAKKPCFFDNSKECPAQTVIELSKSWIAEHVCPICPKRLNMLKGKAGYGEM